MVFKVTHYPGVWVRPEMREELRRAGVQCFKRRKLWRIGGEELLDDGAVRKRGTKKKTKTSRARPAAPRATHVPAGASLQ